MEKNQSFTDINVKFEEFLKLKNLKIVMLISMFLELIFVNKQCKILIYLLGKKKPSSQQR